MSRTYRRKNYDDTKGSSWERAYNHAIGLNNNYDVTWEWKGDERVRTYVHRPETKEERRYRIIREHRDNGPGRYNAPKDYRQTLEQQYRRQCEEAIQQGLRGDDDMEVVLPSLKPDNANWNWF